MPKFSESSTEGKALRRLRALLLVREALLRCARVARGLLQTFHHLPPVRSPFVLNSKDLHERVCVAQALAR